MRMPWPRLKYVTGRPPRLARRRLVALCVSAAIALLSGIVGFGDPFEEMLRSMRGSFEARPASGQIVVAAVDDYSIARLNRWPIPRRDYAAMIDNLRKAGADRVVFDFLFSTNSDPKDDHALAVAIQRWPGHVYMLTRAAIDITSGRIDDLRPIAIFTKYTHLVSGEMHYSFRNSVTELTYDWPQPTGVYPTMAAVLSKRTVLSGRHFLIDPAIRISSIPTIHAANLVDNRIPPASLRGKDIIIGPASVTLGDIYFAPGQGNWPGAYFHAVGAETLRLGTQWDIGWIAPLALIALLSTAAILAPGFRTIFALGAVFLLVLGVPFLLDAHLIFVDVMPAIVLLLILGSWITIQEVRHFYQRRAATNAVSGLPNLTALRETGPMCPHPLIAARILNYAEIAATLPAEMESVLIRQIATRLTLGHPALRLHQGDEGIFAWLDEASAKGMVGDHLDALHTIFRAPISVGDALFDLAISFGVDEDPTRPVVARLGSALVAADEAAAAGIKWKIYDPAKLKEAIWRLSLLSQLDAAIDGGDLWVAYQPKFELATQSIVGAEALVRWTHRDKGPISPEEFVHAAEQSNRIEKLTMHVLDRAIEAAAAINAQGIPFEIAVNISAKLIDDRSLVTNVASLLARHGLDSRRLTLEVTETAAMATSEASLDTLSRLRTLGLQLAIDDYGTGLSTLAYLRRIPANEIKIDRSFVDAMDSSHSDRLLVQSTIELAHSLGRRIVAEGVERQSTLELLAGMGCDLVQGYLIARPMTLRALCEKLAAERGLKAA